MVGGIDVGYAELIAEWFSLASDLRNACLSLLSKTQVQTACSLEESPELFAVLLFCRTITNFKGAISLFQQGLIIEAQTLQRSCFENSLWLRRLAHEGTSFAKAISDDGLVLLCHKTILRVSRWQHGQRGRVLAMARAIATRTDVIEVGI